MRKVCARILLPLAAFCVVAPVTAGSIALEWNPVTYSDLAGYRIHFGTSPGNYTNHRDVGVATSATLVGLLNCREYYVALKAVDLDGDVSASFSDEVRGYPRPILTASVPSVVEQGVRTNIVITGANFLDAATLWPDDSNLTIHSVTVSSCTELSADITVGAAAAIGPTGLEVRNPDRVYGSAAALLTILPGASPIVLAVAPASLSDDVSVAVRPVVTFSKAMARSTITSATVTLRDAVGNLVAQAAGSPSLSADGRAATIVPAVALAFDSRYGTRVIGGAAGVKSVAGSAMLLDFIQLPGFTTQRNIPEAPEVASVYPTNSSRGVPVSVQPRVTFSEAMDRSTLSPERVTLLDLDGNARPQAAGSPLVSADGRTVTILLADELADDSDYRIRVLGGGLGVRSVDGDALAVTFIQSVGFRTDAGAVGPPRVTGVTPASLTTGVPRNVRPVITFTEPVDPSSVTPSSVLLLDYADRSVPQASGSPVLSANGASVTIVPASSLAYNSNYKVRVLGGSTGVKDLAGGTLPATYSQAGGFTTVPDGAAPAISAVTVIPQATTVEIVWTTDEAADSRVFYRKEIDVEYQQPFADTTLETDHSLQIVGLTPQTRYSFYIESTDSVGNVSSSPEGTFTTIDSPYEFLTIEAESGRLTPQVRASSGAGAFRGGWIDTAPFTPTGRPTAPSGRAELSFYVPVSGTWTVWARLFGAGGGLGAWFESIDGNARRAFSSSATGVWEWVPGRSYTLAPGLHVLELGGLEDQARADRVVITNDPTFVATEQPASDLTPPTSPLSLTLTPGSGRTVLRWTNPTSDVARVVVRYRTDGIYPTSPVDGFHAISRPATAGTNDSHTHFGLELGAYFYSVFIVDESGNASTPAQGQAVPLP